MAAVPSHSVGAVILAAGASVRMGRAKMLLPWGDGTVVGHLIGVWTRLGASQLGVVCSTSDAAMAAELDRLAFPKENRIINSEPERGMFSSIQCASAWAHWKSPLGHFALVLGDQPHLKEATLSTLLDLAAQRPGKICQPSRNGRRKHPVLLPEKIFRQLARASQLTLKDFLDSMSSEVESIEVDDPGLDLDIDRPEDYERARRLAG